MIRTTALTTLIAVAGTTVAQAPGDLLFTSNFTDGSSDTINFLDRSAASSNVLLSFAPGGEDTARWGGLTQGPSGEFYVANSPFPPLDPSTAEIVRVDGLLSGAPAVTSFASSNPVQNVTGMAYDPFTGSLIVANNPGSNVTLPRDTEGLLAYDVNGIVGPSVILQQSNAGPRPRFEAFGGGLITTNNPGELYFGTINGGAGIDNTLPPGSNESTSTIGRMQLNDPADPTDNTAELVFDGDSAFTGLGQELTQFSGMAQLPNGNLAVAEIRSQTIWEIAFDGSGAFASISPIIDLSASSFFPQSVIYNQFTNELNYIERDANADINNIVAINLDGTGRSVLLTDTNAGSLFAIPAPGSAALLGLGGLAAVRRRR